MRQFYYYHQDTGVMHTQVFTCDGPYAEKDAAANAPPVHAFIEGHYPHHSKMRVNVETKEVLPVQ